MLEQITSGPADCPNDGFVLHRGKKRRFDHTQQVEPPVSSSEVAWTSNNFYAVLGEIPVNFAICDYGRDAMTDDDDITPFQVFPVHPSVPESVLSASARTKRVVKVIAGDATIVKVDDDWVAMDEFCGQLHEQVHQASKQTTEIVEHQVTKLAVQKTSFARKTISITLSKTLCDNRGLIPRHCCALPETGIRQWRRYLTCTHSTDCWFRVQMLSAVREPAMPRG